ncbi:MAG: cupin domain-containing protein [Pseudoxanthomonas sp.]
MPDAHSAVSTQDLIARLHLAPHPEGGYFRRIHASALQVQCGDRLRAASTAIEFLLAQGQCSQWHRVDADEAWLWRAGGPLRLQVFDPETELLQEIVLGDALTAQRVDEVETVAFHAVPAGWWQRAWTASPWSLVNCVVTPGFEWGGFALIDAAPDVAAKLKARHAL